MEPDTSPRAGNTESAHLRTPDDESHLMFRHPPPHGLSDLVRRFWIPVWAVPDGERSVQRVLQYPVALLIVTGTYARFHGASTGLAETVLTGRGWGVGVLCTPAAGSLLTGGSMRRYTDRHVDLPALLGPAGTRLTDRVRAAMAGDPRSPDAQQASITAFDEVLRPLLPVDDEGRLVNRLVDVVEQRTDLLRVSQLSDETGLSERALERLVRRRLGLTPKWLIQRRRLQDAAERLRTGDRTAAAVAGELGYADQAHFVRDFRRITGMTPGAFARAYRPSDAPDTPPR